MTRLQIVTGDYVGHSVKVPPASLTTAQVGELERISHDIYRSASRAVADLAEALADRDTHDVIVACRRLVAVSGLARPAADRLERSLRG